ncbi:MAG TPA: IS481 family transposase [Elusimicrobiota bacterium]|nr:IS481 family transposase [Elusimicrobiota bacterium]
MDERKRFVDDWLKREWSMGELCGYYGISRKTGYKWVERFKAGGLEALCDQSRFPRNHPNATPKEIEREVVIFRQEHPRWGPKKLAHRLRVLNPYAKWPVASTIGEIIRRHGLTAPKRRRHRTPPFKGSLCDGLNPNDVWTADFKGWFKTGNGCRVDPFTLSDAASRYLLRCRIVDQTGGESLRGHFAAAFQEFGLPRAIRTDNGAPFASVGVGGLSRLAVWFVRLGIAPERIRPGHPEENGAHERMHLTLKQETASPPKESAPAQQEAFDRFRKEYNEERPHESLGMRTPQEAYRLSERPFPNRLPDMEYPAEATVRKVRSDGCIAWRGRMIYLGMMLGGEAVGFTEIEDGNWLICFGTLKLGIYDAKTRKIRRC